MKITGLKQKLVVAAGFDKYLSNTVRDITGIDRTNSRDPKIIGKYMLPIEPVANITRDHVFAVVNTYYRDDYTKCINCAIIKLSKNGEVSNTGIVSHGGADWFAQIADVVANLIHQIGIKE